jgi:photosystem II stability/assembly factor-like uncharacterized protein
MKVKLTLGILFFLHSFIYPQKGWFSQQVPTNIYQLSDIFALNDKFAFAVGDSGKIIKTTDGGTNWNIIRQKDSTYNLINYVFFVDSLYGYAVGRDIIKTTDGGKNWQKQNSDAYFVFNSICFINRDTGWVAGGGYGTVYKTQNGGANWVKIQTEANYNGVSDIYFINSKIGYATGTEAGWGGTENGVLLNTSDGGETWRVKKTDNLYSISFVNSNTGWILGKVGDNESLLYFTNDGGLNWESKIIYYYINKISFINENEGWSIGFNFILDTSDGGESWKMQDSIYSDSSYFRFSSIHSCNNSTGWIAGTRTFWYTGKTIGVIFKYSDSVATNNINSRNEIPDNFSLSQNYPNPFNPTTKIKFSIPTSPSTPSPYQGEGHRERWVTLKVYDILGSEIATLVNEERPAGNYKVEFDGNKLTSGIYFYVLNAGGNRFVRKMSLIK